MNKRFTTRFAVPAFVAMAFMYSCQKKDPSSGPMPDGSTVQFTSSVDDATRTKATDASWDPNDSIGVIMKKAADASVISANKKYTTAAANGNFTATNALQYPDDGSAVNFVAYYPYQPAISGNIYKVNLASQTRLPAIDLMYAGNATGFSKSSSTVPNLAFSHQLARVTIILKAGGGYNNLNGVTATFKQVNTLADFDLSTGVLGAGTAPADVNAYISAVAGSADQKATAILLPQADASGQKVTFKLPSDTVFNWAFPAGTTFEKGKSYNYTVTLQSGLEPILNRVDIQADSVKTLQIVDGQWAPIGINRPYALQKDATLLFNGQPSYRFDLREDDNTLEGYDEEDSKGRIEMSYCYATSADFAGLPANTYPTEQVIKMVYDRGKGQCPQGTKWTYTFSINIPSTIPADVKTIFAQWHGMPSRTLVQTPEGIIKQITPEEFVAMCDTMYFKKDVGYSKATNQPNGWMVEQGGYPPMSFGFSDGLFYIQTNSDRKWMTDKSVRTNASVVNSQIMVPVTSTYKTSTIAYKNSLSLFPKNTWVTFTVAVDWSTYDGAGNNMTAPGKLDVVMQYPQNGQTINSHIVNNQTIAIGRNDENGYYFKFGVYRTGSSTVPVLYNLAGFSQQQR